MKTTAILIVLAAGAVLMPAQEKSASSPMAGNTIVEIKGTIQTVSVAPGQGMPYLEVSAGKETTRVLLGSMRYLMAENFNPKAGEPVEIRGYKTGDQVAAISVTLPRQKTTLKLRDAEGRPLWRGGPGGRRRGQGHSQ